MHQLFEQLKALQLVPENYAVFGSGPLLVRGIIADSQDLDIICRGEAWLQATSLGELRHDPDYNVEIVEMHAGALTFGKEWGIGEFDVDGLINEAEVIDGIPFVRMQHVIRYKRIRDSDKDRLHIRQIERFGISRTI